MSVLAAAVSSLVTLPAERGKEVRCPRKERWKRLRTQVCAVGDIDTNTQRETCSVQHPGGRARWHVGSSHAG